MKGIGYFISIFSVLLLATPTWKTAWQDPTLRTCLILGMITSITGMLLRWMAARREAKKVERVQESSR